MKRLIRSAYELYFVDADRENRCSIYVCIDRNAPDSVSFIFCDAIDGARARKSIRLDMCAPLIVFPRPRYFSRTKFWDIKKDGYDKILMNLLARKNSMFPARSNRDRIMSLYLKHDQPGVFRIWLKYLDYDCRDTPDYTDLWTMVDWRLQGNDPDGASLIAINCDLNISIFITPFETPGLLVYDDRIRFRARRVAKLSLTAPEYLPYKPNHVSGFKEIWSLSAEERKK